MRIAIGWLVLFSLFAAAGLFQRRWSREIREQRADRTAMRERSARFSGDRLAPPLTGRARLEIGRPSGAPPIALPDPPAVEGDSGTGTSDSLAPVRGALNSSTWPEESAPPSWTPPIYELTVPPGQVLSVICQEFYGSGRPPIPQLVAEYNGLPSADHLRAGSKLKLPPLELLTAE